jgi:hypothetical protein
MTVQEKTPEQNSVDKITDKYVAIYNRVKQHVSHDHVEAVLVEIGKEIRMKEYKQDEELELDAPATKKQISFLKSRNVEIAPDLTKTQASELIENLIRQ